MDTRDNSDGGFYLFVVLNLIPWCGSPRQPVIDRFTKPVHRDRADSETFTACFCVELPQHGEEIGSGLAHVASGAEVERAIHIPKSQIRFTVYAGALSVSPRNTPRCPSHSVLEAIAIDAKETSARY